MDKLRVGLWGIGSHAIRNLLPAFETSAMVSLVAIHTRDEDVLVESAGKARAQAFRTAEALLAAEDIDVIYLATPTGHHAEMGRRVLTSGKHLWCEKPLTTTLADSLELLELGRSKGLLVQETDMFLHHPLMKVTSGLIDSLGLGSIVNATARFGFPHIDRSDFRYSAADGGGALLDTGFYPVAASLALLGSGLAVKGAVLCEDGESGVDIGGSALLASTDSTAFLDWGFGRSYRNEIELWCEGGTLRVDRAFSKPASLATRAHVRLQNGTEHVAEVAAVDQFAVMLDRFAELVMSEKKYDATEIVERARIVTEIRSLGHDGRVIDSDSLPR